MKLKAFVDFFARAGFAHRVPRGPGTYGTIVAIPLVALLQQLSSITYMVIATALMVFAIVIAQFYEDIHGGHDSKEIVIDEVVGYVVAMTWLPPTWQSFLAGFVIFRTLDIWKPFPIRMIDRRVPGGLGVVADDVVAGILTNILLQIVFTRTTLLGVQL
jgi:phosphatidylglycerophosphatase A